MSQLPPCSRGGTVRAPSAAAAFCGVAGHAAHVGRLRRTAGVTAAGTRLGLVSNSAFSRLFQVSSSSLEGRHPISPGCMMPANSQLGDVPGRGVDAVEIPAGLAGLGVVIGEEPAAVLLGEEPGEAPLEVGQHADVEDVHDQQVARLGAFHADRAAEVVHPREVDDFHVMWPSRRS